MKINISNKNQGNNGRYKNSSNKNNSNIYEILKRENALNLIEKRNIPESRKIPSYIVPDDLFSPFKTDLSPKYMVIKKNMKELAILNSEAIARIKAGNNKLLGVFYNLSGFLKTRFFNKETYSIKDIFNMESRCIRKIDYSLDLINKRSEKQLRKHLDYNNKKIKEKNESLIEQDSYDNLIRRKEKSLFLTLEELKRCPKNSLSRSTFECGRDNLRNQINNLKQFKHESMIKTKYNALAEASSKQIEELLRFSLYTSRDLSHISKITIEHIDNMSESWNILNEDSKIKNELLNAFDILGNYTVRMETILGNNLKKMYNLSKNNKGIPEIYGNNEPMEDMINDIRNAHLLGYSELEKQINEYKKI